MTIVVGAERIAQEKPKQKPAKKAEEPAVQKDKKE